MKRRAIQLAKKTLVVSLPQAWVRKQGIKKGQEIHVREQGRSLVLHSEESLTEGETIELNQDKVGKLIHRPSQYHAAIHTVPQKEILFLG